MTTFKHYNLQTLGYQALRLGIYKNASNCNTNLNSVTFLKTLKLLWPMLCYKSHNYSWISKTKYAWKKGIYYYEVSYYAEKKSQISKFFCSKSRLRNIWLLEPSCGGRKCFPNQSYTLLSHRDTDTCLDRKNFHTVKAVQFQFDSVSEVSLKSESPFWEYEVTFKQHGSLCI